MQIQRNKGGYFRRGQDIYICVCVHKNMYIYIYIYIYIYKRKKNVDSKINKGGYF